MENANTGSTFVVPTYGSNNIEQNPGLPPSGYEIERAVLSPEEQNTFDLNYEEALRPNIYGVSEQNHDTMPQSVVEQSGEQRVPNEAEQVANMTPEAQAHYATQITRTLAGVRREALTLAA